MNFWLGCYTSTSRRVGGEGGGPVFYLLSETASSTMSLLRGSLVSKTARGIPSDVAVNNGIVVDLSGEPVGVSKGADQKKGQAQAATYGMKKEKNGG